MTQDPRLSQERKLGNVAVFTLGLSPPIVSEFLLKLRERGIEVSKAIAVTTSGSMFSFYILKIAFWWSGKPPRDLEERLWIGDFSQVELKCQMLTMEDIASIHDCVSYRKQFSGALRNGLKFAGNDPSKVHVCVAGGRKTMPVDGVIASMAKGITNVYHVIAPEIPGISQEFASRIKEDEKLREELKRFAEDLENTPDHLKEYALKVCFPPKPFEVHLVKYPLPKLSEGERKTLAKLLLL